MTQREKLLMGVCCGLVGTAVLGLIVLPKFMNTRARTALTACPNHLKQIQGAKATWALEQRKTDADAPGWEELCGPTLYLSRRPECPDGGSYTLGKVGEPARCSIGPPGHIIDAK